LERSKIFREIIFKKGAAYLDASLNRCNVWSLERGAKEALGNSWGEREKFFEKKKYFEQKLLKTHLSMCSAKKISLFV